MKCIYVSGEVRILIDVVHISSDVVRVFIDKVHTCSDVVHKCS